MRYRSGKLDMTHSLASNLLLRYFNSALLADLSLMTDALILSAKAFPILRRSENTLTEETVTLRLQSTVIYGFGLFHLAV